MEEELLKFREKQRMEAEEFMRNSEENLLLADERSAKGEVLKEQSTRTGPSLSAKDAEIGVVLRALEELELRKKSLQDILGAKEGGGSISVKSQDFNTPKVAQVTHKLKVTPPDKWEGEWDRVKLETWIKAAQGYLDGIGIGENDLLLESSPLVIHTIRLLFSSKETTEGVSPQSWFNTRQERFPFTSVSQVFEEMRKYWYDDTAAEKAYEKYRSVKQGTLRAREFGARVEILANACFDRVLDDADRISTFERGLNTNYRDHLKFVRSMARLGGSVPSTFDSNVEMAAVADSLDAFKNPLKRTSSTLPSTSSPLAKKSESTNSSSSRSASSAGSDSTWVKDAQNFQSNFALSDRDTWFRADGQKPSSSLRCWNCGNKGEHYSQSCPNPRKDPTKIKLARIAKLSPVSSSSPSSKIEEETRSSESGKGSDE